MPPLCISKASPSCLLFVFLLLVSIVKVFMYRSADGIASHSLLSSLTKYKKGFAHMLANLRYEIQRLDSNIPLLHPSKSCVQGLEKKSKKNSTVINMETIKNNKKPDVVLTKLQSIRSQFVQGSDLKCAYLEWTSVFISSLTFNRWFLMPPP